MKVPRFSSLAMQSIICCVACRSMVSLLTVMAIDTLWSGSTMAIEPPTPLCPMAEVLSRLSTPRNWYLKKRRKTKKGIQSCLPKTK